MSKVILLNGSANQHGCTAAALEEMIKVFEAEGIETELIQVGIKDIRGCISCDCSCLVERVPPVTERGISQKTETDQEDQDQYGIAYLSSHLCPVYIL